ncbi:lipid A deacylase LpxR family protein [Paraferrimonas sedimenticola]|uniref:Exonuclease n=1 Tax=Paraferrimonas sedimenticola TaxID=375674 RepID=A0AA37W1Z6_9GAMM|nr:lipid A deacylase LpxR family protein [Paraferrimonas sedimenticola]GLP97077.1 exonuclease [Paraferrimonas sedimenticola]
MSADLRGIGWALLVWSVSFANNANEASTWYLNTENDIVFGGDGDYTSGISLGWTSAEQTDRAQLSKANAWQTHFLVPTQDSNNWQTGWRLHQLIWTPPVIEYSRPQPYARPYAGWLGIESHAANYSEHWVHKNWVSVGVTGPMSQADSVQKKVHKWTGSDTPLGWHHQIKNQGTLQLAYEVDGLIKRAPIGGLEWEASGFGYLQAGTLRSELLGGLSLRLGEQLATSFGRQSRHYGQHSRIAPAPEFRWHAYLRLDGGYRFNDLSIEGEVDHDNRTYVEHWRAHGVLGVRLQWGAWSLDTGVHGYRRDYTPDKKPFRGYGSLVISYRG